VVEAAVVRAEALLGAHRVPEGLRLLDEIAPALNGSRRVPLQTRVRAYRLEAQGLLGSCPETSQLQELQASARRLGIPWLIHQVDSATHRVLPRCRLSEMTKPTVTLSPRFSEPTTTLSADELE
jgi:hypothetical protein